MNAMRIVADVAVADAERYLGPLGTLTIAPLATAGPRELADCDVLVVRSGVSVGPALLEGTPVKVVATATSGVDHLDTAWLDANHITWFDAKGSNAVAVAEYVVAAWLELATRFDRDIRSLSIGVVGLGETGGRVARMAKAIGFAAIHASDPPLERALRNAHETSSISARLDAAGVSSLLDLQALLLKSDVVSLHVPLTHDGPDATHYLINRGTLASMRHGAWLINASRGGVAESSAIISARQSGRIGGLVVDVWEGEPVIDAALAAVADLMTPHVAGQSREALIRGTHQVAQKIARWGGVPTARVPELPSNAARVEVNNWRRASLTDIRRQVAARYDIVSDSRALRQALSTGGDLQVARKQCSPRHEFTSLD